MISNHDASLPRTLDALLLLSIHNSRVGARQARVKASYDTRVASVRVDHIVVALLTQSIAGTTLVIQIVVKCYVLIDLARNKVANLAQVEDGENADRVERPSIAKDAVNSGAS